MIVKKHLLIKRIVRKYEGGKVQMSDVPTILIGLGGIGSRVVDRIYDSIPEKERERVIVHAFDTDINGIRTMKSLKGKITQTSTDLTVGQYLHKTNESVKEWFPYEQSILDRKQMTSGAGQIRAVSRLAYRSAMEDGKLQNIENEITKLFKAQGQNQKDNVRVLIVSSLAGGTGSGIFVQTAFYLREFLHAKFKKDVLVRGAFLLPDTLILSGVIDSQEKENVMANGYACLKELDAFVKNSSKTSAKGENRKMSLKLEYRPDQEDDLITPDQRCYDFAFLFDFENTEGENLGAFDNYLEQMVRTIKIQLFSPISGSHFSEEDNKILGLIENDGKSIYCGAGVSTLIYPYQDIIDFCSLKWISENISDKWLKADKIFKEELDKYERDVNAGIRREQPKIEEKYKWIIDELADESKQEFVDPFFKKIKESTRKRNESDITSEGIEKSLLFIEEVENLIEKTMEDDKIRRLEEKALPKKEKLSEKEDAMVEVSDRERDLAILKSEIIKVINDYKNSVKNRVINLDLTEQSKEMNDGYNINAWILGNSKIGQPLHPVAVRYFLYSAKVELMRILKGENGQEGLEEKNENLLNSINNYGKSYEDKENNIRNVRDKLEYCIEKSKNPLKKLLGKDPYNQFKDEYCDTASNFVYNLKEYKKSRLKELVFQELVREIDTLMASEIKKLFDNLTDVNTSILNEIKRREKEHENAKDPTKVFVLGSKDLKEKLWKSISNKNDESAEISKKIYQGQFERYSRRKNSENIGEQRTEQIFRETVLQWCKEELSKKDSLNMNIIKALRKEAELNGKIVDETEEYIVERLKKTENLCHPFIPKIAKANAIRTWGGNAKISEELNETTLYEVFKPKIILDSAISEYEIICYEANYGLRAQDFEKFSAGLTKPYNKPGTYYQAYKNRIDKLVLSGNTVTPHLDKRWHLPAYMPDLNEDQVKKDKEKIDKALIMGLIFGYLKHTNRDNNLYWTFYNNGYKNITLEGELVRDTLHELHEALSYNPDIVDQIINLYEAKIESESKTFINSDSDIVKYQFYIGSKKCVNEANILENLFNYSLRHRKDKNETELKEKEADLIRTFTNEVVNLFRLVYGSSRINTANERAALFIIYLRNSSLRYMKADKTSSDYQLWEDITNSKINSLIDDISKISDLIETNDLMAIENRIVGKI